MTVQAVKQPVPTRAAAVTAAVTTAATVLLL